MRRLSMPLRGAGALAAVMAAALLPVATGGAVSAPRSTYVVELAAEPLAAYDGGVAAFGGTSPRATGQRLDVNSPGARRYAAFLDARQERALGRAGAEDAPLLYRYRTAFPGFAAKLTPAEVARLRSLPEVRAVTPDGVAHPAQAAEGSGGGLGRDGAAFLGLPDGLWKRLGGPGHAGEGVIVAILDTGIYPEHPSFADQPEGEGGRRYQGPAYEPPQVWRGACQSGEAFPVTSCNNKLVGARYFVDGFGAQNIHEDEFLSPRDASGHGSHVAATAAGNYGVDPVIGGHDLGVPLISGIAPRAYVAMYKVCWAGRADPGRPVDDSCVDSDAVAAIDAAVADGVDVINYSVGSITSTVIGPVERAFLFAVDAGVFVANSGGNDGPVPGSIGSPTAVPWVTSVAASTLARAFEAPVAVTSSDGSGAVEAKGATLTGALPPSLLVDAAAVPAPGVAPEQSELCLPGTLDPAAVAARAVLCKRGNNPRVEKGKVVLAAGGVGMVLYNAAPEEQLSADFHFLPAVHVTLAVGQAIKALVGAGEGVEAEIGGARPVAAPGDVMAGFSSRGPQSAVPDIPKPDLSAPGVDILAAATPTPAGGERRGETFRIISGTSMSSPHVAGAAALLTQLDPARSPAAIKSALMTTATPALVREDGKTPADPFDVGSGRIDPNRAARPGLVVEAALPDYVRYLEGQDPEILPGDAAPLSAVDLNLPAISFGSLPGVGGTARTFTSVDPEPATWQATVEGLAGIQATVTPAVFDLGPGQSQAVDFDFAQAGAPFDAYAFGAVVLTHGGDGRTVRLPVSIRPVKVATLPGTEIKTDQGSGSAPITVRAGFQGELSGLGWGLAPPRLAAGETVEAAARSDEPPFEPAPGVDLFDVQVPPGTQVLAAEVSNADGGAPDTDLDLYLFHDDEGDGFTAEDRVAASADGDAEEAVAIPLPSPGSYRFTVVGFKTKDPVSVYDFTTWLAADSSPDDPTSPSTVPGVAVTGDPKSVAPGEPATLTFEWSGIPADGVYLGLATFHDSGPDPLHPVAQSIVRISKAPTGAPARAGPRWGGSGLP